MTTAKETFQIPLEIAEAYEARFVPAIFAEWAPHILRAAGVTSGHDVLDVACGTGIVARTASTMVGRGGTVTGVDLNDAMLIVASRVRPDLEWVQGGVDALPFPDDRFDAAVCQMALMFFPDRLCAFEEMARVVRPGGTVAVVVPASLEAQPAYGVFVEVAARHAGPDARSLLATYWNSGDADELSDLMGSAGVDVFERRTRVGTARFSSSDDFVATEVEGSPLVERIDAATHERIRHDVHSELAHYATDDGRFEVPLVGHVIAGRVGATTSPS